ncbi:MAG: redoxin domain-containing protein [Rhodospirillales bacterium]|nr:redoxin domain-containing protein [Rhodospirillales bacterium]
MALLVVGAQAAEAPPSVAALAVAAGLDPYPAPLRAPAFRLPDLNGTTQTNDDFKGRVIVLSFWASWCPPCKTEFPSLEFKAAGVPVAYLLNREGRLVAGKSGAHDWDAQAVRALVRRLIEGRKS